MAHKRQVIVDDIHEALATVAVAALINRVVQAMVAEGVLERDAAAEYPTLRVRDA